MKKVLGTFMVVLFATVVFGQSRTEIKTADLPKPVMEYMSQNMKGSAIDKAFKKVDKEGVISYSVIVMSGTEKTIFHFDKNGNFEKKDVKPAEEKKPARKK